MTLDLFLLYLAIGRLFIWLIQIAGILAPLWRLHSLLEELRACDLCLGFWVFLALAFSLPLPFGVWHWLIETVILAGIGSTMVHFLRLGWQSKFGVEIL